MLDALTDVLELFLSVGIGSPDTLEKQRRTRLIAGGFALAVNAGLFGLFEPTTAALFAVGTFTLVAVWVVALSAVDAVKELPAVRWLSVAAFVTALAAVTLAGFFAL